MGDAARRTPTSPGSDASETSQSSTEPCSSSIGLYNPLIDSKGNGAYKKATEGYRNETKESITRTDPRDPRQPFLGTWKAGPALATALWSRTRQRNPARPPPRPGSGARTRRFLRKSGRPRHRLPVPSGPGGQVLRDRPRHRPRREVHEGVLRPRSLDPEVERQDQHRRRRGGGLAALRERRGRRAAGRGRGRIHPLRRVAAAARGDPRVPEGAPGLRAPRDAGRDVVVSSRARGGGQRR